MRKAPAILLIIVSLLWHTFAMAHAMLASGHAEGVAHVALHLENEPHHHHDDGSFHQDRSDESVQHVHADGCANTAGVVPTHLPSGTTELRSALQPSTGRTAHDSPILEGPRRPPRLTA